MQNESADIICIGAGISGAVIAERYASLGKKVLVLEKRDHIGGNCYDYFNEDGILVSKYGPHLFHTNFEDVWRYVQHFSEWYKYEHHVMAQVENKLVPVPVNIQTVNLIFGLNIKNEEEMKIWLSEHQVKNQSPQNSKEAAEARVGVELYQKIFENYTKKQWAQSPDTLDAEVLSRIPVRTTFEKRYFTDKYQFLPEKGYTKFFEKMFDHPNITVKLNSDYFDLKDELPKYEKLFYTGPIDQFFEFRNNLKEKLEYRSLRFEHETMNTEFYQNHAVINFPEESVPYTRIVEYKHMTGQKHPKTTIVREYPSSEGEPFYPVPTAKNRAIYEKYKKEADKLTNIYFVGRLANYKYFNMDQAFKNALDLFSSLQAETAELT
ncbi:UDP-galactopyranose mutase [soil metagenome]